jgi:hypothetical protein
LHRLDQDCAEKGLNRSKWLSNAIEAHLNHNGTDNSTEFEHLRTALDQQGQQIAHYKELLAAKDGEIMHLRELSNLLTSKIIPALPVSSNRYQKHQRSHFGNFGSGCGGGYFTVSAGSYLLDTYRTWW